MRRLLRFAVQLYPSWWRRRYANELEALLDDVMRQRAGASARAVEDLTPGWREVFDILQGALAMQLRSFGTIPAICALAGAILGGVAAMRIPAVYATSATSRLDAPDLTTGAPRALEVRASLEKALGQAGAAPAATTVTLDQGSPRQIIRVTYADRDPVQAQRGAERLAAAIAADSQLSRSSELLSSPSLPAAPVGPDWVMHVGVGSAIGLGVGGVLAVLLAPRRRRISANEGAPPTTPLA
jgi:hypothetical protein